MRRQWAITALCVAILVIPLWGQRHGSFGTSSGGSGIGSGSMGHATFSAQPMGGGLQGSPGSPAFASAPRFGVNSGALFGTHSGTHFGTNFGRGFRQPFPGSRRFHQRGFFRTFSPYYFGYYGYPGYYSDYSYSSIDSYPAYDYYAPYPAPSSNDLAQQQHDIDRLEDEVARLREERESTAATPAKPPVEIKSAPTLLVFRDKHTQEVQNYAVVGGTLWIFSEQRATKLPLSWLDIDATTKANDERGVDFRLPN
jgi:hypothetical protein